MGQNVFRRGCTTKRLWPGEMSYFGGQSIQSSLTAQNQEAYRDGVPDAGKPTRTALHSGAPGTRQGQVLFDARPGSLDVDFFLHKNKLRRSDSGVVGVQVCRPNKTGTKLYSSEAFFSTTIMNFTAGVAVFFSALHHMWKAWCKQGKKSVGSWFDAESASPLGGELS